MLGPAEIHSDFRDPKLGLAPGLWLPIQPPTEAPPGGYPDEPLPYPVPLRPLLPGDSDESGAGGLIEIDGPDDSAPEAFGDSTSKREELAVLSMLASLKYRPGNSDGEFSPDESRVLPLAEFETPLPDYADPAGHESGEANPEGGMVAIAVDENVAAMATDRAGSLLDISVEMDNVRGKDRALEVLTTEAGPLRAAVPGVSAPDASPAPAPSSEDADINQRELVPSRQLPSGPLPSGHPGEPRSPAQPAAEVPAEDTPPMAEVSAASDQKNITLITAAALLSIAAGLPTLACASDGSASLRKLPRFISRVLFHRSKEPMNCKEMIEAMAKKALWTSPGGKTPHATLYSAIIARSLKGKESRFVKKERGQFAAKA